VLKIFRNRTGRLGLATALGAATLLIASATLAQTAYVPGVQLSEGIRVVNTTTNTVTTTIAAPNASILGVGVNFAGTRAYFTDISTTPGSLLVVDTSTGGVISTATVGATPYGVAANPAGTRLYVANQVDNSVTVLDAANYAVLQILSGFAGASGLVVKGDGTKVYVSTNSSVTVLDTSTSTTSTIGLIGTPRGIAINRTGTKVYAALLNGSFATIDTATNAVVVTASGLTQFRGIVVSPAGAKVYAASNSSNQLAILDTATNTVTTAVIGAGGFGAGSGAGLSGVSMTQDGTKVFITSRGSGIYVFNTSALTNAYVATSGDLISLGHFIAPPAPILNSPAAPVPTLSEWAMILFGLMLAGGAAVLIQRRRQLG